MTGETPLETPEPFPARRGFSLSYKGKTLLSRIDPAAQAERMADAAAASAANAGAAFGRILYFCPSPLYGYGLERLLERISPNSAILCVETDENLMALSLDAIDRKLTEDPRFALVRTASPAVLCTYTRQKWGSRCFRRVETLRLTGGWQLDPKAYEDMAAALRRNIAVEWGNAMTLVKLGRRYIKNALRNLALIPRSPSIAEIDFGEEPVLVLGAGPSLDGFLPALKAFLETLPDTAKRPFKIICVDTALGALKEWGIMPDLAVALESQHWNIRDFIGMGDWTVPVAMDLSALPATAGLLGGRSSLFVTPWAPLSLFGRMEEAGLLPQTLPPLGSVGLSAMALARVVSHGQIISAGLDFSFTIDRFHARSTPAHRDQLARQNRFRPAINAETAFQRGTRTARAKSGRIVRTSVVMQGYRDLFEEEFSTGSRILDLDGPGLPLGIQTISPAAVFDILKKGGKPPEPGRGRMTGAPEKQKALEAFIQKERASLALLKSILQGERPAETGELEGLLDWCGYLWAHFPDCAGAGGRRPPSTDISFLKRVRVEIDPCIDIFDWVLGELGGT